MSKIHILPIHEAHKIAAGEVIERPSHILKELIENSIDAHATQITLYIQKGGKELLRIVDNGIGMDKEDARLCFQKHATSKIIRFDDLQNIATFGFRGEALASVAAVSRVILKTKESHAQVGIEIEVFQSSIQSEKEISLNGGTDIAVYDLFAHIPARKKFLKSDQTEWRAMQQLIHAFCFAHPRIGFTVYLEGKQVLDCAPTDCLRARWQEIFNNTTHKMLEVSSYSQGAISVYGIISNHQEYAYDRSHFFFFVNNRWVKNQPFYKALLQGYAHVLPQGRFAKGVLIITCDAQEVDINIHPRKEEVKFLHPIIAERVISTAVRKVLEGHISKAIEPAVMHENIPEWFVQKSSPVYTFSQSVHDSSLSVSNILPVVSSEKKSFTAARSASLFESPFSKQVIEPAAYEPLSSTAELLSLWAHSAESVHLNKLEEKSICQYAIIGQYHKTYILIEKEEGLFLVDQHAAHERILYEQFSTRFGELPSIPLISPIIISVTMQDRDLLVEHFPVFAAHGIQVDIFGAQELVVHAVPVHVKNQDIEEFIKQVLAWLHETAGESPELFMQKLHEKIRAQMACKAAVKAGDSLTIEQMQKILQDLDSVENRFTCPHGRPTGLLFSLQEIEKKFKRRK